MAGFMKLLRVFYGFLLKRKWAFVAFISELILASVVASILPYFFKIFVDALTAQKFAELYTALLIYIAVRFLSVFLDTFSYFLGDVVWIEGSSAARLAVFKKIQDLDFAYHTSKSTGSLISAIKRGDIAFFNFFDSIHHTILDVIVGFAVMTYFFTQLDLRITVYVFISFLLALLVSKLVIGRNMAARKLFNEKEDEISSIIVDNMMNYDTVKLFAKEGWEYERLKNTFKDWKRGLWRYSNSFRVLDISVGSLINLSIFLILFISMNSASHMSLSVGNFVLIAAFISAFYPRLFMLVFGFRDLAKHYSDMEKYFEILDYKIYVKDPDNPKSVSKIKGEVEFKNVSFSYDSKKRNAVSGINLRIRNGQSIALVGRSGVGKTTLIKLLLRFYDVDRGEITIDGANIKEFTKKDLRSFMGVVPQEPILFNNTIAFNIGYADENATSEEIIAASKMANIHKFISSLPDGYQTEVGERGIKLSGGQKQRLAIARMILSDPKIIIFDEATSQLDSENESLIKDAFWKVAKNKTTIIIAHRLSTAMKADKIVVMEKGKIVEAGSHKMLIESDESLYKYFWNLQVDPENFKAN